MPCVLDMNVIYGATGYGNLESNTDPQSWDLIDAITRTCDKVLVSPEIIRMYGHVKDEMLRTKGGALSVPAFSFFRILFRSWPELGKVVEKDLSTLPLLPADSGVKDEDQPFVRLAVGSRATLATYDGPLHDIGKRKGWPLLPPREAISTLVPST